MKRCLDCPADISARPHARYCDDCRWRHRGRPAQYVFDDTKDTYLRAHYTSEPGCSQRIGALWGYPADTVRRRAARLGLAREGCRGGFRPWTADDEQVLVRYAALRHPQWIARKLQRSVTAIVVKVKRLGLSQRPDGYTQLEVASGFGVERGTVERWIRQGRLRTANVPLDGQAYAFTELELVAFLCEHRSAYDLRKVGSGLVSVARVRRHQRRGPQCTHAWPASERVKAIVRRAIGEGRT